MGREPEEWRHPWPLPARLVGALLPAFVLLLAFVQGITGLIGVVSAYFLTMTSMALTGVQGIVGSYYASKHGKEMARRRAAEAEELAEIEDAPSAVDAIPFDDAPEVADRVSGDRVSIDRGPADLVE